MAVQDRPDFRERLVAGGVQLVLRRWGEASTRSAGPMSWYGSPDGVITRVSPSSRADTLPLVPDVSPRSSMPLAAASTAARASFSQSIP
jgi:hypothetical protein